MKMVQETEDYSNAAEEEEIKYATGQSASMHDLMIAAAESECLFAVHGCGEKYSR